MQDGYFPRDSSMLRRVHEQRAVGLFYGQRALCVGAIKPLTYVGTSTHTHGRSTPFRRISHTGEMFETVFFGTRAQADRVLAASEFRMVAETERRRIARGQPTPQLASAQRS
jgi:ER-bound oxygenase mpaB/B'/Rubber oxygenase, catalytic domain